MVLWVPRQRNEWELPGPSETVVRKLAEELGFATSVKEIIAVDIFTVKKSIDEQGGVLVTAYLCNLASKTNVFEEMSEAGHAEFKAFKIDELEGLKLIDFYKDSIIKAECLSGTL